jgi:hypothetical protein
MCSPIQNSRKARFTCVIESTETLDTYHDNYLEPAEWPFGASDCYRKSKEKPCKKQ